MSPYVKFTRGSSVMRRSMKKVSVNFSREGARPNANRVFAKKPLCSIGLKIRLWLTVGVCEFDRELFKLMQRLDQNYGVWVLQGAGGNSDTNVPCCDSQNQIWGLERKAAREDNWQVPVSWRQCWVWCHYLCTKWLLGIISRWLCHL